MAMFLGSEYAEGLLELFRAGTESTFKKGDFIVRPGELLSGVYYIEEGLVKSYDITKYGDENLMAIRKAGEVLGLTAVITGDVRRILYTALVPTRVLYVPSEQFLAFLEANPKSALPLLELTTKMYRDHSERILTLEYRTVRERLVSFLLTAANHFGTVTDEGVQLDVPLRHQDIASSISATRETTGREITNLERRGLLKNEPPYITLLDTDALRHML